MSGGRLSKRARDADRSRIADILDAAYAEGQIDGIEHRERVSQAIRAKTLAELDKQVADLQFEPTPPSSPPARTAPQSSVPLLSSSPYPDQSRIPAPLPAQRNRAPLPPPAPLPPANLNASSVATAFKVVFFIIWAILAIFIGSQVLDAFTGSNDPPSPSHPTVYFPNNYRN